MRLGKISHTLSYVVDLDNIAMADHAKAAIMEDITELVLRGGSEEMLAGISEEEDASLNEGDIPEFLRYEEEGGDE